MMQVIAPGPKTVKELSRWCPSRFQEWHFRRLLKAGYWSVFIIISWFAEEAMKSFPPPSDGVVYVIGDSSEKPKRGKKNPSAQKGKKGKNKPFFFGIRFAILVVCWDVFRIPVDFRIILPKDHKNYKNENQLFREMLENFRPPDWAETVIVMGDAAYASRANMKAVKEKDKADCKRRWFFVFSVSRTWKQENGKSIKDFVTYLPHKFFKKTWIPPLCKGQRRKLFWIFGKVVRLRHVGEVTVVLSKKGRNVVPKKTKILVTNLPNATARQVISAYQRRWSVEIIFKELKSGLGLGQHQVTKKEERTENSFGVAIIAYLFLLRACKNEIKQGESWSIFRLKDSFRMKVITNQIRHTAELEIKKFRKSL